MDYTRYRYGPSIPHMENMQRNIRMEYTTYGTHRTYSILWNIPGNRYCGIYLEIDIAEFTE